MKGIHTKSLVCLFVFVVVHIACYVVNLLFIPLPLSICISINIYLYKYINLSIISAAPREDYGELPENTPEQQWTLLKQYKGREWEGRILGLVQKRWNKNNSGGYTIHMNSSTTTPNDDDDDSNNNSNNNNNAKKKDNNNNPPEITQVYVSFIELTDFAQLYKLRILFSWLLPSQPSLLPTTTNNDSENNNTNNNDNDNTNSKSNSNSNSSKDEFLAVLHNKGIELGEPLFEKWKRDRDVLVETLLDV